MNVQILNGNLLTNMGNMLKGKQRAWKTCYFHIISWWKIGSIALPSPLPASLYRISQVFVSPDSFAFLLKGTLVIDITTLSFSSSTMKENLPLDFLYLKKKKIEFRRPDPVSFGFLLQCAFKYLWTATPPYSRYRPPGPLGCGRQ